MRGIGGLLVIIALLYFTGAGSWMWKNVQQLDTSCYTALQRVSGSMASPVCDAVSRGVAMLDNGLSGIGEKIQGWKQSLFGSTPSLDSMTASISERLTQFSSSSETLTKMMQAGPGSYGSSTKQSIQQAIDSFTIGQGYLKQGGSTQALEWFQRGAQQPQGYGLMSQLQLGNLYMTGNGVPQNNQAASAYLQQASNSITILSGNNSPQSQQLLGSLPGSPQQVKAQLDAAIRQLQIRK